MAGSCPDIDLVVAFDWDKLVQAHLKLADLYVECALKHDAIVEAWSQ